MNRSKLDFITFDPVQRHYRAYVSIDVAINCEKNIEKLLFKAANVYKKCIKDLKVLLTGISKQRESKAITARKVWRIGNAIFSIVDELRLFGFQLDGVYEHLERDLEIKRKLLEKAITFRRYVPNISIIPKSMKWSRCEKATRRIANDIRLGKYGR